MPHRRTFLWVSIALAVLFVNGIAVGSAVGLHYAHSNDNDNSNTSSAGSPVPKTLNGTVSNSIWKPTNGTTWQYVLSNIPQLNSTADNAFIVWDFDLFDTSAASVANFQRDGRQVICYFSAGSYENWRPDASDFQPSDLGNSLAGWHGERWLNTTSINVRNIMLKRMDVAVTKGCDGVDPDNIDGYDNDNGLRLTQADAVNYLGFLADAAHARNLSTGPKNGGDIVPLVIDQME